MIEMGHCPDFIQDISQFGAKSLEISVIAIKEEPQCDANEYIQ